MICPFCESVNRDNRDQCYHCDSDLSMLRLVINKAKQHYNLALEHAERQRYEQAISELRNTLDLSANFVQAHVVLGTIYAKLSRFDEARTHWEKALALNPDCLKAYQYLKKVEIVRDALPAVRRLRLFVWSLALLTVLLAGGMFLALRSNPDIKQMSKALDLYLHNEWGDAQEKFQALTTSSNSFVAEAANQWVHIITLQIQNEETQISQNVAKGNLSQARKAMAALIKKKVSEPNAESIRSLATLIQKRDIQLLADTLGQWRLQQKTPEEAMKLIEELDAAYAGDTRIQEARQAVQSALDSRKANSLDRILADYEMTSNTQEAILQVRRFLAANPNHQAAEGFLAILLKEQIEALSRSCRDAIADRRLSEARQFMAEIAEMNGRNPSEATSETLMELSKSYSKELRELETNRIKKLTFKEYTTNPLVLTLAEGLLPEDRKPLESLMRSAKERIAEDAANWMANIDYRYERLSLTTDQASQTIILAPMILEAINARWLNPKMLFFQGAAYLRVGDRDAAEKCFEKLVAQYPQSKYAPMVPEVLARAARASKPQKSEE